MEEHLLILPLLLSLLLLLILFFLLPLLLLLLPPPPRLHPAQQLSDNINVSKEARQAISKAASVFVLYATSCANNFALKGKRKTLAANDIFQAMEEMEFERFVPELKKSWEGESGSCGRTDGWTD